MFWVWDLYKGAYRFKDKEEKFIRRYLELLIHDCPKSCAFLSTLDLPNVEFYWAPGMTEESGILGAWDMMHPKRIYMAHYENEAASAMFPENNISRSGFIVDYKSVFDMGNLISPCIAVTVVHELTHMFQFQTNKVLYCINRLVTLFVDHIPYLERIGIEYDARQASETEEVQEFADKVNQAYTAYVSAVSTLAPDDPKNWLYKSYLGIYQDDDGNEVQGTPPYGEKYMKYAKELFDIVNVKD